MSFKAKKIANDHPLHGFMETFDQDKGFQEVTDDPFESGSRDGYGPGLDFSPPVDQGNDTPDGGYSCSNCAPSPGTSGGFGGSQDGNTGVPTTPAESRGLHMKWTRLSTLCDRALRG